MANIRELIRKVECLNNAVPDGVIRDGIGGVMTKYAERTSGGFSSTGKAIIPLTEDKAKKWAEDYLTVEEYEGIFGDVEE